MLRGGVCTLLDTYTKPRGRPTDVNCVFLPRARIHILIT